MSRWIILLYRFRLAGINIATPAAASISGKAKSCKSLRLQSSLPYVDEPKTVNLFLTNTWAALAWRPAHGDPHDS